MSIARALSILAAITLAAGPIACADQARCDAALEGVSRARAESLERDRRLAWLAFSQARLLAEVHAAGAGADRDALLRRLAALEAENAALIARLDRAERDLLRARPPAEARRRLDEAVPYRPAPAEASGKEEGSILRKATHPARKLDEAVPYERGMAVRAGGREPAPRRLDEVVPY